MTSTNSTTQVPNDLFAAIATDWDGHSKKDLVKPAAENCEGIQFPLGKTENGSGKTLKIAPTLKTQGEFNEALQELKKEMLPFTRQLAPNLPGLREKLLFKNFDWRIETAADRKDFLSTLNGKGDWETVQIPHYDAPLGPAATLYRKTFTPSDELLKSEATVLCFDAVDYIAQVYLNGVCVGVHEGIFDPFELEVTGVLREGENTLLVRVENDNTMLGSAFEDQFLDGDKIYAATGLGYDDPQEGWHHCPPGMGIWQGVRLEGRQRMAITDTFIHPSPEMDSIEVELEVTKYGKAVLEDITVEISIFGQNFEATVLEAQRMDPTGRHVRGFGDLDQGTPDILPLRMGRGKNRLRWKLPFPDARIWDLETPWLYQAQFKLLDSSGTALDTASQSFGMRSFIQDEDSEPKGRFLLNGKEIRLRGANTMGNIDLCVFRSDFEQLQEDILIAKLTRMNFLRLTQHPVQKEVYEACDQLGLLLQTDLPTFGTIRHNQVHECVRQSGAMERLIRSHPSSIMVSFINEPFPAARGRPHRAIDRVDMERFFSMARLAVERENPYRVIKNVDGDYDPPTKEGMQDNHCYCGWYIGHGIDLGALYAGDWLPVKKDWYYGCGEYGSEGLDSLEVMQESYPKDWLPERLEDAWNPIVIPRAQSGRFYGLWYSTPKTITDWIERSQEHQEWITRLMTEAFRRKSGMNTFAIHLFIDAWPSGWMKTIMDVKRIPKKAWFAYRDALSPLAVQLRSDRTTSFGGQALPIELWTVNDLDEKPEGLSVHYAVCSNGETVWTGQQSINPARCAPTWHGNIEIPFPLVDERTPFEILATLIDKNGEAIHSNRHSLEVFPVVKSEHSEPLMTDKSEPVESLLSDLGLTERTDSPESAKAIVIQDLGFYQNHQKSIDKAVQEGARVIFLKLPVGKHNFGGASLEVLPAGMGPRHFVAPIQDHPVCENLQDKDLKFWFDERLGRVSPILDTILEAPDWTSILQSSDGGWRRPWGPAPAAVERTDGEGLWRVCQMDLFGRVQANPAAALLGSSLFLTGVAQETFG